LEGLEVTAKKASELFDRLNEGLASRDWVVVKSSDSRDTKSSHFVALIGDQPLKALKAFTLKPYRGLSRATATLPTKERKGNYNGKGNVEPIIQINFHHSKNA
jgi:hypothetical protein